MTSQLFGHFLKLVFTFAIIFAHTNSEAAIRGIRWTGSQDKSADLNHVITAVNTALNLNLTSDNFMLLEDRYLSNSQFRMYVQTLAGVPIKSAAIRTWTDTKTKEAIQVEAYIEDSQPSPNMKLLSINSKGQLKILLPFNARGLIMAEVRKSLKSEEDNQVRGMDANDFWQNGELVRIVKVKVRRGTHEYVGNLSTLKIMSHTYKEFPQADAKLEDEEFFVPAKVFEIYEETEKNVLQKPVDVELKYLKKQYPSVTSDPYDILRTRKYLDAQYDTLLGATIQGQGLGYWSSATLRSRGENILKQLPLADNTFANGGVVLEGRYATVSLHPDAVKKFQGLNFTPEPAAHLRLDWLQGQTSWEVLPRSGYIGKKLVSFMDAYNRPAVKDPENDPVKYINEGFDEVQVYYGVTRFMESLQTMGMTDPELSTRPFNAFLYDPDIAYRDNAYYTDDTINFTTYSKGAQNYARDNSTIWHELGHGIMDRLMGDYIQLADTGGLSEGMADFLAALVVADVSDGKSFDGSNDFRIINNTGFNLTNEVHDDGESYGGAMKDLLDAAIKKEGRLGLHKVTDLTLETMRLTRNHPGLTANDWFNHMIFADELGRKGLRASGEMKDLIVKALNGRNFSLEKKPVAFYSLKNGEQEVLAGTPGSRQNPIPVLIKETETSTFNLKVQLIDGEAYKFQYPVTVKVEHKTGALQGAIKWVNEEAGTQSFIIAKAGDALPLTVAVQGKCDFANREDGSCVDYAYVQIFNNGSLEKPVAKKRFYLRVKTQEVLPLPITAKK